MLFQTKTNHCFANTRPYEPMQHYFLSDDTDKKQNQP